MEFTGKMVNVSKDWNTGQFQITFTVNEESVISETDSLKNCEKLVIKAVKYRKKRSLDANAYLWVLCTKIADVVRSSKDEIYEDMLQKYGVLYQDEEGNYLTVTVKAEVNMSKFGHWKFYKSNGKFSSYILIKGTSEYNTAEMARFVDAVISEAKELGIETMTDTELQRLKELWGVMNCR